MSGQPTPTDWTDSNELGGITKPARNWLDQTNAEIVRLDAKRVGRNLLINGGFDILQCGGGSATPTIVGGATPTRGPDCWRGMRTGGVTGFTMGITGGGSASTDNGNNRFAGVIQRTAADVSTANMLFGQTVEPPDMQFLKRAAGPVVLSFRAKAGANYSGGALTAEILWGTGFGASVLNGFTAETVSATTSVTLTTSYQDFTVAGDLDEDANQLGVRFTWTPSGTAGADDAVYLQNVQLEEGEVATGFQYVPIPETLRLCKRFYQKTFPYGTTPAQSAGNNGYIHAVSAAGAIVVNVCVPLEIEMRNPPGSGSTVTFYNPSAANAQGRNPGAGADTTLLASYAPATTKYFQFSFTQAAGSAVGQYHNFNWQISDDIF